MSKTMTSVLAAAALIASASLAFAQGAPGTTAQPVSNVQTGAHAVCQHDGDVIQGPNGLLVCHMRPQLEVHFKSSDWYRGISARAAGSNG
jgi:hypothetical protein